MFSRFLFTGALAVAALGGCSKSHADNAAADNTGRNQRDNRVPTADKAVETKSDLDVTQKLRKAVMDDGSLSTNAHNCKIVVQDGKVTLVGPVADAAESARLVQIAAGIVGDANVINQLEVITK
jgi:osmotically-inducible protein OsmY